MMEDLQGVARALTERPLTTMKHRLRDGVTMAVAAAFIVAGVLAALAALAVVLERELGLVTALLCVSGLSLVLGLGVAVWVRARAETERRLAEAEAKSRQAMLVTSLAAFPGLGGLGAVAIATVLGILFGRSHDPEA